MSAALYLRSNQLGGPPTVEHLTKPSWQCGELRERVAAQTQTIEELRVSLRTVEAELQEERVLDRTHGRRGEEAVAPSAPADADIEAVRAELEHIRNEANRKIDSANERIRALRQDSAEAALESARLNAEVNRLAEQKGDLLAENRQLTQHKEALIRIVDDLCQTCKAEGLTMAARRSIDSVHQFALT